jgi:hypothetical protein
VKIPARTTGINISFSMKYVLCLSAGLVVSNYCGMP